MLLNGKEKRIMGLFGREKKEAPAPCCGGNHSAEVTPQAETAKTDSGVKVLGGGCAKCSELEANTRDALAELGMDTAIGHVTDFAQIAAYGVMATPALVVDGRVVSCGRALKKDEAKALIRKARG